MAVSEATVTRVYADCQVAAVGSNETIAVYTVPKGTRVLAASAQCLTASDAATDSTWWVGDTGDPDGLISSFDTEQTAGAWIGPPTNAGAYMTESGGKLYNAATAVNAYYTQGATDGATAPKIRVVLLLASS